MDHVRALYISPWLWLFKILLLFISPRSLIFLPLPSLSQKYTNAPEISNASKIRTNHHRLSKLHSNYMLLIFTVYLLFTCDLQPNFSQELCSSFLLFLLCIALYCTTLFLLLLFPKSFSSRITNDTELRYHLSSRSASGFVKFRSLYFLNIFLPGLLQKVREINT